MTGEQGARSADSLEQELLALLAKQSRRLPVPIFLAAAMIAWLSNHPGWPHPHIFAWLGLCAGLLVLRRWLLGKLPSLVALSLGRRLHLAVGLNAIHGLTYAAAPFFFDPAALLPLAITSLLLVGLCAGSVATTAGHRDLFLAYAAPVLSGLVLRWSAEALVPTHASFAIATAAILALFAVVLVSLAADSFRLFKESFDIRLQQLELNQSLREALGRVEAASRAKTRFLASASHDLRQPIHTLSLFAASLSMRPLDTPTREISANINMALECLSTQLDGLLDMSKLDAGVVEARLVDVDLAALCVQVEQQYAPLAAERGIGFVLEAAAEARVRTDPGLLARVVGNLVDNAIKYTAVGEVTLALVCAPGQAVIVVQDTGRGIPPAEQAKVFEEFYQVDNPERNRAMGLGLGLSIVARLVNLLGARLEMASKAGVGTAFYLALPLAQPSTSAAHTLPVAGTQSCPGHILVVDDEAAVRHGMKVLLEGLGARVSLADGMDEAVRLAQEDPPDILLSDFRLRGDESGIGVIDAVRRHVPGLPAALISGDTSPERLREAHAARLTLLHKPVPLYQLRQTLSALAAGATNEEPSP